MTRRPPAPSGGPAPWPPYLPHPEIDALMRRFGEDGLDAADLERLCLLISNELHRVRSTTAQLANRRLEQARAQASEILAAAREKAEGLGPCVAPTDSPCPGRRALS